MTSILETIKNREVMGASSRLNVLFAETSYRAARILPTRFQWIVPMVVEQLELPIPEFPEVKAEVLETLNAKDVEDEVIDVEILTPPPPLYTAYRCLHGNPLQCGWPAQTLEDNPNAKTCVRCGFPALLPSETRIQGKRGRYQIEAFLKSRNLGRLYRAIDLLDRRPIIIKEYLLPSRHFTNAELRRRQHDFDQFTNLELADRRTPDLRWDVPIDEITQLLNVQTRNEEGRAFTILPETPESFPTLGQYLEETGALTPYLVRNILLQVLQSLEGLHEQKYRLPTGIVETGLIHGNISLDSLLIVPNFQGFYIYLSDPALWEHLFMPPNQDVPEPSVEQDLQALGNVAFYLLAGRSRDPGCAQALDPGVPDYWPQDTPEGLRRYILSLVGLNNLPFESAHLARQALLKLPIAEPVTRVADPEAEEEEKKEDKGLLPRWFWILLAILLGASALALIIWFFEKSKSDQTPTEAPTACCISQITGLPLQKITFTGEQQSVWTPIWQQANLIAKDETLEGIIDLRLNPPPPEDVNAAIAAPDTTEPPASDPNAEAATDGTQPTEPAAEPIDRIILDYLPMPSTALAIDKIRTQEAEFAISSLVDNLGIDLWYQRFAYDAIVVYVAFSYEARQNGLPHALNGKLSLDQLRRLYTGEVSNWREIGGPDLAVKLYRPNDEEAIARFEQQVLQTEGAIAQFRDLSQRRTQASAASTQITQLSTFRTLNAVLRDFEGSGVGAIAFGSLSQVFGQCSVYPLALHDGIKSPVAPLVDGDGFPITPATDLCNEKGSYRPNIAAMREEKYPLTYPLAVIYPRDNRRQPIGEAFATLLQTDEAQLRLQQAGLIPLREVDPQALEKLLQGE